MNSNEQLLPQRSDGGLAAMDAFYRGFNEVNFYVEDADQENLYFEILKSVFPDVKLEKIFPLGGKSNVLSHAKDSSNSAIEHKVYILDKDFDDLLNKKETVDCVHYLDKFCIENYLLDENALVEVVIETDPKLSRDQIRDSLALDTVLPAIGQELREIFGLFFLVQMEELGIPNCKEKPERFCNKKRLWEPCPTLQNTYLERVNASLLEKAAGKITAPILGDSRLEAFCASDSSLVVSGKFWLAMIFHYLKSKYNFGSITFSSFVFRLAKNCDFSSMENFVTEVNANRA